jgi:hypothetical protein
MLKTGPMQLNQPQPADAMEPYFTGTQPDGGLWTDMSRLSAHDHSGGLLGTPVAVDIPDGSITAADLHPSTLAPYALTDGSKPFTGQVTMQADAIVRDTLYFGPQGSADAPDALLERAAPNTLRAAGSLITPLFAVDGAAGTNRSVAWRTAGVERWTALAGPVAETGANAGSDWGLVRHADDGTNLGTVVVVSRATGMVTLVPVVGQVALDAAGVLLTRGDWGGVRLVDRGGADYWEWYGQPTALRLYRSGAGAGDRLTLTPGGGLTLSGAGSALVLADQVTAGRHFQLFAQNNVLYVSRNEGPRLTLGATGTLTVEPDAAAHALVVGGSHRISSGSAGIALVLDGWQVIPTGDGVIPLGEPAHKWTALYATNGTIQTSSREAKQDITPLDPAACAQAVLDTDWVSFEYTPPPLPPGPPGETVAQSTARVTAHSQAVQGNAFARKQKGYVLGSPQHRISPLFGLEDRQSASPQADLAVVACGLQDALRRISALEGAAAA